MHLLPIGNNCKLVLVAFRQPVTVYKLIWTSFLNTRNPNFFRMVTISIGGIALFRLVAINRLTDTFRVLLSSSFVPFIVTFLHAIAAKDMANVALLEQVVGTLENFRSASQGSESLYQICVTFAQVAKKLVQSERVPVGTYDQEQDSLQFADTSSLLDPEILQDGFESGEMTGVHPSYAMDILGDWLSGPPFPWDNFDVDIENLQREK